MSVMRSLLWVLLVAWLPSAAAATDPVQGYPSAPRLVVLSYCEADHFGAGLTALMWPNLQRYTTWTEAASWQSAVVVAGYRVEFLSEKKTSARIRVEYQVVGNLADMDFTPRRGFEKVIFDLIKQDGQWKIEAPRLAPHISVAAAIKHLQKMSPNQADVQTHINATIAVLKSHLKAGKSQ